MTSSLKLDDAVKRKAQAIAKEFGLSLSTVVNAQLKQFIRDRQLVLTQTPQMSSALEELLGPIEKDLRSEKHLSEPISNEKDLDRYFAGL